MRKIVAVAIGIGLGLTIFFVVGAYAITAFGTMVWGYVTNLPQTLSGVWALIQQNLIGAITGFVGALAIFGKAYSVIKQRKQQAIQTAETKTAEISGKVTELQTAKDEAVATLTTKQTEFTDTVKNLSNQLADTQKDFRLTAEDNLRLTQERNMLANKLKEAEAKAKQRPLVG